MAMRYVRPTRAQYAFGAGIVLIAAVGLSAASRPHPTKADRLAAAQNLRDTFTLLANCPRPGEASPCLAEPPAPHAVRLVPVRIAADVPPPDDPVPPAQDEKTTAALEQDQPAARVVGRHHSSGGDICARTGGRKVETRQGRGRRCVYARR